MRLIFKHAPAASNPNSLLAHEAVLAAGAQGKFWEMHDLLFTNQTKLARDNLIQYAKQLNLNLSEYRKALDDHTYRALVERDLAEARGLGVTVAPTLFINGRRMVGPQGEAAVRAVIASVLASVPRSERTPRQITASGPAQIIDLEHAPFKGPAGASVSLVEFTDFECPYCGAVAPVIRELLATYPQQVRFSLKHYPLPMHKQAPLAHEAALAAGEQGKLWEMHDLLFANQDKLTREDIVRQAQALKLDLSRFLSDLDSHRFKAAVEADRQEGAQLGVDGTPYFFINGHALSGAPDLATLKRLIETTLKEAAPQASK